MVFDRPGFGYSDRPRDVIWTPSAQADLIRAALVQLDIPTQTSWGASVASAIALKYPTHVRGLMLASGYYYPSARLDVLAMDAPALPIVGDILSYTLSPLLSRLAWPMIMNKIFGPKSVQ
jgi:pimeloyl-ACP methyl ester carboxylesterase